MQTIKITTSQNIDIDYEVAGLGERILARLIDMALFILIFILVLIVMGFISASGEGAGTVVLFIIVGTLFVFYDLICEIFMNGQSVGKRVMKIKVISLDGGRPSIGQYILRWLFRIVDFTISFQVCGLICAAVTENTQRVGDVVAGTTLIKTNPRVMANSLVFKPMADGYVPVFNDIAALKDTDIALVQEVIRSYFDTGNHVVVYNTATRIKQILSITAPPGMEDLLFLQTIVKDYSHIISVNDQLINS